MTGEHLSEEEIQLYVLQANELTQPAKQHLEQCTPCQARAKEYELLFSGIQSLDKPSFDFDVAALVLPQLEEKKKTAWYKLPLIVISVFLAAGLLSVPFFIFSAGSAGSAINSLWNNISPWVIGIISIMAVGFIGINIWDSYTRYRHQLDKLNFQ